MPIRHPIALAALLVATLGACANLLGPAPRPGQTEAEVIARLGKPTHVYEDGGERLLEYMHGPRGQYTEMARIGADGKLVSYEQVLTMEHFAAIKIGVANKAQVLRAIGAPSEERYFSLSGLEEWSYPFKENGIWDSRMSVYFDKAGIVRKLENGPDPQYLMNGDLP